VKSSKSVSSRRNPLVERYRAAARRETPDILLLDGVHLVSEAAAAGLRIREIAVKADALAITEVGLLVERLTHANVDVVTVAASVMDALSQVRSSSTVVALAECPKAPESALFAGPTPAVVITVDVQDPGNLGSIARVAEAGGASGLIAAGAGADPFGWKALRGSMGSALRLPIILRPDAARAISDARAHGCRVVATVPRGGRSVFDVDYRGPVAILVGGEGAGLSRSIVEAADERVTIPMAAPVESLNAAVAAALIVYEVRRQRTATKPRNHET
jgi:TrmH family RNA methyltransferase